MPIVRFTCPAAIYFSNTCSFDCRPLFPVHIHAMGEEAPDWTRSPSPDNWPVKEDPYLEPKEEPKEEHKEEPCSPSAPAASHNKSSVPLLTATEDHSSTPPKQPLVSLRRYCNPRRSSHQASSSHHKPPRPPSPASTSSKDPILKKARPGQPPLRLPIHSSALLPAKHHEHTQQNSTAGLKLPCLARTATADHYHTNSRQRSDTFWIHFTHHPDPRLQHRCSHHLWPLHHHLSSFRRRLLPSSTTATVSSTSTPTSHHSQ